MTAPLPIAEALDALRAGRMLVIVDDARGETGGDLFVPAELATADHVNFMTRFGGGLVCLALTPERVAALGLPLLPRRNVERDDMEFAVSIEAREGVTTGISAADRARTIAVAIAPGTRRGDLNSPGHVFPLVARRGGVLARTGWTEAAVDLARLAGFDPSGVICKIMDEEGGVATGAALLQVAATHELPVVSIADLIAYRTRRDKLVRRVLEREIETRAGGVFRLIVYENTIDGVEHVALVKGEVAGRAPVLVRMHAVNLLDDIVGDRFYPAGGEFALAMERIAEAGSGVLVLIREAHNSSPSEHILERESLGRESGSNLRDIGTGAQILADLGVREMILLSRSSRAAIGLEGYELEVRGHERLSWPAAAE